MIFSSWLGTYLDFLMVEKKFYCFPVRLFPEFFKINIMFTLFVLPFGTAVFLFLTESMRVWMRNGIVLILAMAMSFVEQLSEKLGWFCHGTGWRHSYSFFGYMIFMWLVMKFHRWMQS